MAEYPDSIKMYIYVSSAWLDITSDVIAADKITGYWGMASNRELDRVARPGSMFFSLDNTAGKYSPNLSTATTGWGKGTKVKLDITYRGRTRTRFYGAVDNLKISGGALGLRKVQVTVKDWMDYAVKYPLVSPGYATNKRADEAITTILAGMPIQPQSSTLGTGEETFPTVFDAVTTKTTAQSEFVKLAMSEMGYIYHRKDGLYGDNLRFDARTYRKGTDTPTTYSVPSADDGFLLKEDGGYLLTESGDKIIIERAENLTLDIDNNMQDVGVTYGDNIINRVSVNAYPRRIDTSNAVLFSIGYPMPIAAGETIEFRGNYFDPTGGAVVNAVTSSMVTPAATTDYLMNEAADGSGTDRTAKLTIVATYGTEGVTYELRNTHTYACYITKLQARGFGVYTYSQLESTSEDQPSINAYGYASEVLHQEYQQDTQLGKNQAAKILDNERLPRTKLNTVSLNSSKSPDLMYGFIVYDVGDLVHVVEDVSGVDSNCYVQAVSFSISAASPSGLQTGIIDYSWTVKQSMSLASTGNDYSGLSLVAAEFSRDTVDLTKSNGITFGTLDTINNLTTKSISFWISASAVGGVISNGVIVSGLITSNWYIYIASTSFVMAESDGYWRGTHSGSVITGDYFHVVITKTTLAINTVPNFYINGAPSTFSSTTVAQTVLPNQEESIFNIGGKYEGSVSLANNSFIGKIKDVRVYDRILSAGEVAALYTEGAGGTGNLSGIVFQAPVVKTQELPYFTDHTMIDSDRVIDNVYLDTGRPIKESTWTYPIIKLP